MIPPSSVLYQIFLFFLPCQKWPQGGVLSEKDLTKNDLSNREYRDNL